jgi:hypothetical protein
MHPNLDTIRAYFDGELASSKLDEVRRHLEVCPDCARQLAALRATSQHVTGRLNALSSQQPMQSPQRALSRFYNRQKEQPMKSIFRRPIWAAAVLVAILAVAMVFPPVRALAGSFLGIFRVQQVRVISFDPSAMQKYDGALKTNSDKFQAYFNQYLTVTQSGTYQEAKSKLSAARIAGFTPRLPAGTEVSSLGINPAEEAALVINSAAMNAFLQALDRNDVSIPSDLDGQQIKVTLPTSITAMFGTCPEAQKSDTMPQEPMVLTGCTRLIQLASPTVQAPESFPIIQLGESMFQLMGMTPDQAKQLSQSIDWASTLIIPVPAGNDKSVAQVSVDGVTGNLVSGGSSGEYTLIWIKNGIVYALIGNGDSAEAIKLANSLQ